MAISSVRDAMPPRGFDAQDMLADQQRTRTAEQAAYRRILSQQARDEESAEHRVVGHAYRPPGMGRWVDRLV
jgi:hypothetical protein